MTHVLRDMVIDMKLTGQLQNKEANQTMTDHQKSLWMVILTSRGTNIVSVSVGSGSTE